LYCRYILCKSFEAFREIVLSNLTNVPVEQPLLLTNEVASFHRGLIDSHQLTYRHDHVWGDQFDSHESYARAHPDSRLIPRSSSTLYPCFVARRPTSRSELTDRVAPSDAVTRLLIASDVDPDEISFALAYQEHCAGERFQEIYRLRPVWPLYFAATNLTSQPLRLRTLLGEKESTTGVAYRHFFTRAASEEAQLTLPAAALPPGATLLAPVATLLGPLRNTVSPEIMSKAVTELSTGQIQTVSHDNLDEVLESLSLIGPGFWPSAVRVEEGLISQDQPVHEFDPTTLYTVSRYWEIGCCPHLFAQHADDLHYIGPIFSRSPGISARCRLVVPHGTTSLHVVELEPEVTFIESILVNSQRAAGPTQLVQGQSIRIVVSEGDDVEFIGYYLSRGQIGPHPWERNRVVADFVASKCSLKQTVA
jgi:hypothetical protein